MNCSEFHEHLHDYFQELPEPRRKLVEAHAEACEKGCRELLSSCLQLTCREFISFLNDYVDGVFPPERATSFEQHLALCGDCSNYLDSYRKTMSLNVLALGDDSALRRAPPPDLLRAILASRPKP